MCVGCILAAAAVSSPPIDRPANAAPQVVACFMTRRRLFRNVTAELYCVLSGWTKKNYPTHLISKHTLSRFLTLTPSDNTITWIKFSLWHRGD